MLTEVKASHQHSGIHHMAHFSFISCSRINRSGSESGKHSSGRAEPAGGNGWRAQQVQSRATRSGLAHPYPQLTRFQIQMMYVAPYIQTSYSTWSGHQRDHLRAFHTLWLCASCILLCWHSGVDSELDTCPYSVTNSLSMDNLLQPFIVSILEKQGKNCNELNRANFTCAVLRALGSSGVMEWPSPAQKSCREVLHCAVSSEPPTTWVQDPQISSSLEHTSLWISPCTILRAGRSSLCFCCQETKSGGIWCLLHLSSLLFVWNTLSQVTVPQLLLAPICLRAIGPGLMTVLVLFLFVCLNLFIFLSSHWALNCKSTAHQEVHPCHTLPSLGANRLWYALHDVHSTTKLESLFENTGSTAASRVGKEHP